MSKFHIYPAIDIRGGKCVRLLQGDYAKETVYGDSPFDMAARFEKAGAEWIHMVDLDGAKEKRRVNHESVIKAAKELSANIQVGGGIRTAEDVEYYLNNGVDRVILGSVAVQHPEFAKEMLRTYKEKIAIGLDARDGYVAVNGWLETSEVTAVELGKKMAEFGAQTFIFTDIAKDGMLSGPNVTAICDLAKATGKKVIASGGVSKPDDIKELAAHREEGVSGVIIGKAIYTGKVDVDQALAEVE
ncbi:1-(5-phosphoribosyl)-5-[(5-phosphoribosylamino)methylideneamino] imidazole-4-carboxamide isomerase [Alteribacillus persepolensis]|uniref:1-(5-phosphoribosyl)-5-[(5-phosphoribosylamino)methylideneamino] imidazole-4-carboxamide isomerase n=1 Tax=Alteribacillus persepolensis TaxID=568899 RepID=A0A1G8AIV6_9BACI|nr:1-(5-phosphoribosyl)-5-[(5-phosphoribosylamino)methylideneamino]imidazole-4-carboxamide isomerase [Alteribacillus persepolensis]SDH20935.1 1-(5-phosphoribosyl)-5-[(5-phosphoribosylamino)methylideneamino] imidazole-4-carboxamide isomerase [Alteribacillus persepolensis]